MSASPPRRLLVLAEPGSTLADGLTAAQLRGPSQDELRALERELAATLGGAALLGAAAAGAATVKGGGVVAGAARAWLSMSAVKVTAVVALAAAGTTGAVAWRRHATHRERATAGVERSDRSDSERFGRAPTRVLPAISTAPTPPSPQTAALPPPSTLAPAPTSSRPGEISGSPRRAGALRARPPNTGRVLVVARPPALDPPPRDESSLVGEVSLIKRAQEALSGDPSGALAVVEEHERRYAAPALVQEREVIAVAALAKLGRTVEARARAERFIRSFPESAHVARVRRLATAAPP